MLAIALLTTAVLVAVAALPPIPQPEHNHDFADQRVVPGVPHALNILSNLGFLIVGAVGLGRLWRPGSSFADARERWPYAVFFVSLVGGAVSARLTTTSRPATAPCCGTGCR